MNGEEICDWIEAKKQEDEMKRIAVRIAMKKVDKEVTKNG